MATTDHTSDDLISEFQHQIIEDDPSLKDLVHTTFEKLDQMFDLAYAALKLNSAEIEKEIIELRDEVDFLQQRMIRKILLASRSSQEEERGSLINMILLSNQFRRLAGSAERMAQLRALITAFDQGAICDPGEENILLYRILQLPDRQTEIDLDQMEQQTGRMVLAIRREHRFLFDLAETIEPRSGDILICRTIDPAEEAMKLFMNERQIGYELWKNQI